MRQDNLDVFEFFGHGDDGTINTGNGGKDSLIVSPAEYTQYGIAEMKLYACDSVSVPPGAGISGQGPCGNVSSGVNGVPAGPGDTYWRYDVAPGGELVGFLKDVYGTKCVATLFGGDGPTDTTEYSGVYNSGIATQR